MNTGKGLKNFINNFGGIFLMKKSELVSVIAEKGGWKKKDADTILNVVLDSITESLQNGEKVSITGFGTFQVKERGEKKCINPRTKQETICPASKAPVFKAGKTLKEVVNK